jgi:transcriptional regulator with XRE-family HTH domain
MQTKPKLTQEQESHPLDRHIGKKLRQRRLMRELTQTDLGKLVGVTFQQMQKYERGVNRISASKLYEFAQVMNIPVSYFFEGAPPVEMQQGFAENAQEDLVRDASNESQERGDLLHYYFLIQDAQKRKKVLDLIRAMGEEDE